MRDNTVKTAITIAIDDHPEAVADYRDGESDALNYLVGQVMQATGGRADPSIAAELHELNEQLSGGEENGD